MKIIQKFRFAITPSSRAFCAVLSVVLLLLLLVLESGCIDNDYYDNIRVFDRAGFLSEAEMSELDSLLADQSQNCDIYVATHSASSEYDTYVGDDFLRDTGFEGKSLVLLVITKDRGTYYYDIYTYGTAYKEIKNAEVDRILDAPEVYDNIKGGRLKEGISAFARLTNIAVNGRLKIKLSKIIIVSSIVAGVISAAVCFGIYGKYKLKIKPTNYPLGRYTNLVLTEKKDSFAGSFVTRRKIQKASSNGTSSHSGGGSGHRGGR